MLLIAIVTTLSFFKIEECNSLCTYDSVKFESSIFIPSSYIRYNLRTSLSERLKLFILPH
jgi:hypothetical protein